MGEGEEVEESIEMVTQIRWSRISARNVVSWIQSWNRKWTLVEKLVKLKKVRALVKSNLLIWVFLVLTSVPQ